MFLFLDIDEVLNSHEYWLLRVKNHHRYELDKNAIKLLNLLMEQLPDLKIIISSSQRKIHDLDYFKKAFAHNGFLFSDTIIGMTPSLHTIRGLEINEYCRLNGISNFAIVDDGSDMLDEQFNRFIHINAMTGITILDILKIIKVLDSDNKFYQESKFYIDDWKRKGI